MFKLSNENKKTFGLNFFDGEVKPLKHFKSFNKQMNYIGWNKINLKIKILITNMFILFINLQLRILN